MSVIKPSINFKNNCDTFSKVTKEIYEETEDEKIDRLMSEHFDPHYPDFESFKKDLLEKINIALKEVDEGKCMSAEEFFKESEKWGENLDAQ